MKSTTLFSFSFFFCEQNVIKICVCVNQNYRGGRRGFSTIIPPSPQNNFWGQILVEENLPLKLNVVLVMGKREIQEQNRCFFIFILNLKSWTSQVSYERKRVFLFLFFSYRFISFANKKEGNNRVLNVWTQKQAKIENFVSLCLLKDPWYIYSH